MSDNELTDKMWEFYDGQGQFHARELLELCIFPHLAERGMVVFGPDGEPLDVRSALRALGEWAFSQAHPMAPAERRRRVALDCLRRRYGITGDLAAVCLAAVEVEP